MHANISGSFVIQQLHLKRSPGNMYFSDVYFLVKDTKNETYRSESGVTGEPGFGFHGLVRRSEPITGLVGFTTPHAFVPMVPAASIMSSHITVLSRWSLLNITRIRGHIYPIGVQNYCQTSFVPQMQPWNLLIPHVTRYLLICPSSY